MKNDGLLKAFSKDMCGKRGVYLKCYSPNSPTLRACRACACTYKLKKHLEYV